MTLRSCAVIVVFTVCAIAGLAEITRADIYVRIHQNGHREFTNRPSGLGWMFYMKEDGSDPVIHFAREDKPKGIDEIVGEIANKFEIEAALVKAIIKAESNCNPNAVSRKGAQGLMQLMPATAKKLKVEKPLDPQENILGGVKYIKGLMASYGDLRLALAAYNAGPGTVQKYEGIPPYRETVNYVKKVISFYKTFKQDPTLKVAEN